MFKVLSEMFPELTDTENKTIPSVPTICRDRDLFEHFNKKRAESFVEESETLTFMADQSPSLDSVNMNGKIDLSFKL